LIEDYLAIFEAYVVKSPEYGAATFHLLMGQLPAIRNIQIMRTPKSFLDSRVHVVYFSPTGSGKGEGFNLFARLAAACGVTFYPTGSLTTKALIGSVSPRQKGEEKERIKYGALHPERGYNIVASSEGKNILKEKPGEREQDIMTHLQQTMNTMGTADATVSTETGIGDPITFQPNCSLLITSHPIVNLSSIVLETGFLQRTYFVARTLSNIERQEIERVQVEREKQMKNNPESLDTTEAETWLVKRLQYVNSQYLGATQMIVDPGAVEYLNRYNANLYEMIGNSDPFLREQLGGFITRFRGLRLKLAANRARLSLHETIQIPDASYADYHTKFVFANLLSYLERTIDIPMSILRRHNQFKNRTLTAYKRLIGSNPLYSSGSTNGWVLETDLIAAIKTMWSVTGITAVKYIEYLTSAGVLSRETYAKIGNKVVVKLKE